MEVISALWSSMQCDQGTLGYFKENGKYKRCCLNSVFYLRCFKEIMLHALQSSLNGGTSK